MSDMLAVTSPFDGHTITEVPMASGSEAQSALATAYELFNDRARWLPKHERIAILDRAAAIMEERVEELTRKAAEEGGKPYVDSKVEVLRAIQGVKLAVHELHHLAGEEIPMGMTEPSVGRVAFTIREPIGVVVSVSAFNHPLNLIVHQTVGYFAVGCPVVIKPAGTTPLSCINFVNILYEAGMPEEWIRVVVMPGRMAEKIVTDRRVNYFSFIGSPTVGWALRSKLSPGTRCALEHGGAAPVIITADADVEAALAPLAKGGFYHAGQVCVSVQRIYAEKAAAGAVADGLAEIANRLVVGDPVDPKTEVGPLIQPAEVNRVEEWVNEARDKGGQILCGGERLSDTCYKPTVILDPPDDARVSTQEIFGPVICVYESSGMNDSVRRANGLPYAFQASVFTKDLDTALDATQRLNATAVMVNDHTAFRVDWMPFGGRDESGLGLGGIPYTMHEATREKLIVFKSAVL